MSQISKVLLTIRELVEKAIIAMRFQNVNNSKSEDSEIYSYYLNNYAYLVTLLIRFKAYTNGNKILF